MPITAFIGVRISWLMVARNALLASLAVSAAARASCASLEQPRVLDRDHRLVGEGLQQRELLLAERLRRLTHQAERADAAVFPQHRRPGHRAVAAQLDHPAHARRRVRHRRDIGNVHRAAFAYRLRGDRILQRRGKARRHASRAEPRQAPTCTWPRRRPEGSRVCVLANRCWQLSRIFSNTGAVSATELLITCSTSAVAVCCSSASFVSLNKRTFSIAITAWSAKVCSSATSLSLNRPGRCARPRSRR